METNPASELTMGERFEQEKVIRALRDCQDKEQLRERAIDLFKSWMALRAMLRGQMFADLPKPPGGGQ
jgi:hypothetical protein